MSLPIKPINGKDAYTWKLMKESAISGDKPVQLPGDSFVYGGKSILQSSPGKSNIIKETTGSQSINENTKAEEKSPDSFSTGINYWPIGKAMNWWKEFDAKEVAGDFARLKELGFDNVRIFLIWEDFQPQPGKMNEESLKNMGKVLDIADSTGLKVMPTFFTGHMSGINFLPKWVLTKIKMDDNDLSKYHQQYSDGAYSKRKPRNIFKDEKMLKAEEFQVQEVVKKFSNHNAVSGWDLGNGITRLFSKEYRNFKEVENWRDRLTGVIKKFDKKHPVTLGPDLFFGDMEKFDPSSFKNTDILAPHVYNQYVDWIDDLDPNFASFVTFMLRQANENVLIQEVGVSTAPPGKESFTERVFDQGSYIDQPFLNEKKAAKFFFGTMIRSFLTGAEGAWTWCWGDQGKFPLFEDMPHEQKFGIARDDGSLKPHAHVVKFNQNLIKKIMNDPEKRKKVEEFREQLSELSQDNDFKYAKPITSEMSGAYKKFSNRLNALCTSLGIQDEEAKFMEELDKTYK